MRCRICEMNCDISEGGIGGCGMYVYVDGEIFEWYSERYFVVVDIVIESMLMVYYYFWGKFL